MNLNNIFNAQTKTVTFAALLLGFFSTVSAFLGIIRDGLLAGYFGVWGETNAYFAAFRITDFFYNLFIVGGLVVAFLPLFSEYYSKGKELAWEMTNYVLNFFFLLLSLSSLLIFIFAPQVVQIITPGFSAEERNLTVNLVRIMVFSPIFFGLSAIFSGILQYFNRFLIYSVAPVLYNLGIIGGILFFSKSLGILGVGLGVIFGAVSHLAIQIVSAKMCGFRYRLFFNFKYPAIKKIFSLALPRLFAMTAQQINLIFITAIASGIAGGVAVFNFANNLQGFPLSIIGVPFAVAVFPILAKDWVLGKKKEFLENFSGIFRQILFLMIPVAFLFFILRAQIVRLILGSFGERGKFDWAATQLTAASLGLFSLAVLTSAFIPLLVRAFFSFQNTKTPTLIAVVAIILNIILSLFFIQFLKEPSLFQESLRNWLKLKGITDISIMGLPLAFSISSAFQFVLLLFFLRRNLGQIGLQKIFNALCRIIPAGLLCGAIAFFSLRFFDIFFNTEKVLGILAQTILSGLSGMVLYFTLSWVFKFPELNTILQSFHKQFRRGVVSPEIEIAQP